MSRPWLKSWVCSLDKPKIMALPGDLFKVWQVFQWIAERADLGNGALPPMDECAFAIHKDVTWIEPFIAELVKRQLLDVIEGGYAMHDWPDWQVRKPSDEPERIRERVAKHRAKHVTPRNAIPNVTEISEIGNARNAFKSEREIREEKEEKRGEGKPPAARATRIPDTFLVDEEMDGWAYDKGMSEEFVAKHTESFVLTFKANGNAMKNWRARWQKWMLDAQENGGQYKKRA